VKEIDVGAVVAEWLSLEGFTVYQEIEGAAGILDIAARRGPVVWAVECKVRLNYDVIAQAKRWVPYAHRSLVACPCHGSLHPFDRKLLDDFGLGLLDVRQRAHHHHDYDYRERQQWNAHGLAVLHRLDARFNWRPEQGLINRLREGHRTMGQAGQSGGARKSTCLDLREYVREHPGCSIKEAVDGVPRHHYHSAAAARSALLRWIKLDKVSGVRAECEDGQHWLLYPAALAADPTPAAHVPEET
jgi:hypothetical protein